MKEYFKELGILEAIKKAYRGAHPGMMHEKSYDDFNLCWQEADQTFQIGYKVSQNYVTISKRLACCVPREKESNLCEVLNYLNSLTLSSYAYFHPKDKTVELKAGVYVLEHNFDPNAFRGNVFVIKQISKGLFPILKDYFSGKLTKKKCWKRLNSVPS